MGGRKIERRAGSCGGWIANWPGYEVWVISHSEISATGLVKKIAPPPIRISCVCEWECVCE